MLALTVSDALTFQIFYFKKVGQGHGVQFGNDAIQLQISKSTKVIFTFLIFAKIRPVVTTVTHADTHTYTQRN